MASRKVGPYRLKKHLGNGQSAVVYSARRRRWWGGKSRELVAIKLLHEYHGKKQERDKFEKEAAITRTLDHPGIIKIIEISYLKKTQPYIVMTYAPGDSLLKGHSSGVPLPLETIRSYTNQIADALAYAHERKVIHCDVKPDNIFVGKDGRLLLGDFGISRIRQATLDQTTGEMFGTPKYMAPEQFEGKYNEATDQYALAVMVYEWLCGAPPFAGENFHQLMNRHMLMPVPSLLEASKKHSGEEKISQDVEQVILKALAKEPHDRFSSVQEFAKALDQALLALRPSRQTVQPQTAPSTERLIDYPQPIPVHSGFARWMRYSFYTLLGLVYILAFPTVLGLWLSSWWAFGVCLIGFMAILAGAVKVAQLRMVGLWATAAFILSVIWGATGWVIGALLKVIEAGNASFSLLNVVVPVNSVTIVFAVVGYIFSLPINLIILSHIADS